MKRFRLLPSFLACLTIGFVLSLTVFLGPEPNPQLHRVDITTVGSTADIENAVRALGRNDVQISNGLSGVDLDRGEAWVVFLVIGTAATALISLAWSFLTAFYRTLGREP